MTDVIIPPYVYEDHSSELSLQQGDILRVDGKFGQYFGEFYPAIQPSDGKIEYVVNSGAKPRIHGAGLN